MADADTSMIELFYEEETNWGQIPGGTLQELRFTGEDLSQDTQTQASDEIRGDRQVSDQTRVSFEASGPINYELTYGTFDDFFAHALMDSWSAEVNISASDIGVDASAQEFTSPTGSGTDFTANNISVGQWVKADGFSNTGNNDYWYVTSVAEDALGVRDNAGNLSTEAAGPTVTVDGSTIRNGTTKKSLFIEKHYSDIGEYNYYTGMRVNTWDLSFQQESKVTGSFGFHGKEEVTDNQSSQGSGTNGVNSNQVFNTGDHLPRFVEGGSVFAPARQFTLSLQNQVRPRPALGQQASRETGVGTIGLSGTLQAYFSDPATYKKYLNFTDTSFSMIAEDKAGNGYIFTIHDANFTDGGAPGDSVDSDVIQTFNWSSKVHDSEPKKMIQIDRFSA